MVSISCEKLQTGLWEGGVLLDRSTIMGICAAVNTNKNMMFAGQPGTAKCFAKNTPILMYDGTIKLVQNVAVGDILMGDDSTPRRVLSLSSGKEMMYKVSPQKGDPYIVNEHHILSLKMSGDAGCFKQGEKIDIWIKAYLMMSNTFKHYAKGYRTAVNFQQQPIKIDPYFLGVWLGDGTSNEISITTVDKEIIDEIENQSKIWGSKVSIYDRERVPRYAITNGNNGGTQNPLLEVFRSYNLIKNKHIPYEYKVNSREVRLNLLAGLIDTDGTLSNGESMGGYTIVTKFDTLKDDILFLSRSLGFAAYAYTTKAKIKGGTEEKDYWRIFISGDVSIVPVHIAKKKANKRMQKKDVLVTGLSIEECGVGDYYGFIIDGNRRFLLSDFTVVHNTKTAKALAKVLFDGREEDNYNNKFHRITATPGITRQEFFGDWNYHKQFLEIQAGSSNRTCQTGDIVRGVFREDNFIPGPAFEAIRNEGMLFIDEGNRGGEDFQNMVLEVAEEKQVTVPMLGTIRSKIKGLPITFITYNEHDIGTQPFSDAFKRRFNRIKFKPLPRSDTETVLLQKHGDSFLKETDSFLKKVIG